MTCITKIRSFIQDAAQNEDGVTAIEYGLIAGLVSVLIVASTTTIGTELVKVFAKIATAMTTAGG